MLNTDSLITGLILAGGQGSRMGGKDKGLVLWHGRTLIEHTYCALTKQVPNIVISANRHLPDYRTFGVPIVSDEHPAFDGPIAGICSAINHLTKNLVNENPTALMVTPCDTPNIPCDLVARLYANLAEKRSDVSVAFDGERLQNLHCLIRAEAWQDLLEFYALGNLALRDWFKRVNTSKTDFSDKAGSFKNINHLEQLDL
ncbi:MAG: molybdenum cofactor guanylyltransferase MobA [Arenicella sp.]|nr:molybdenum cofactor guanylyltransferase MobA [Arenicella sp.]HAU69056.1 molybdenum cofactor guanylyltransferase [Gammaproteobacteria bacterium]